MRILIKAILELIQDKFKFKTKGYNGYNKLSKWIIMIEPKKRIRRVLFSAHKLSYRITQKPLSAETMNKKLFVQILDGLRKIEERRDFMESEIGLDMTVYEDQFFDVIENLFRMSFSKEQYTLINTYLYQLMPDMDWNGKITINVDKKQKEVDFKNPEDVWNVIKKINK